MVDRYEYIIYLNDKMTGAMRKVASLSNNQYQRMINKQEALNRSTDNYGRTLKRVFGSYLTIYGAKQFAKLGTEILQTRIQFETLSDTAKNGDKLFESLNAYANRTPYLNSQINRAAVTMQTFGVSQEKVLPFMQRIGDVASGNADRLAALSLAFGQTEQAGRLMGQDLFQYINAGFSPLQEIQRQTGISGMKLRKMMQEGLITSKMVEDAFISATSKGGRFYQMMDKMSQEAFGRWSTFMGQMQYAAGNMSLKIQEGFKPIINDLVNMSTRFLNWSKNVDINAQRIDHWVKTGLMAVKMLVLFKTATAGATYFMRYIIPAYKAASYGLFALRFQLKFATAETFAFSNMVRVAKTTWLGFSAAMKANVIGLAITGVTLLITKLIEHRRAAKESAAAQKELNNQLNDTYLIEHKQKVDEILKNIGAMSPKGYISMGSFSLDEINKIDEQLKNPANHSIDYLNDLKDALQAVQTESKRTIDYLNETQSDNSFALSYPLKQYNLISDLLKRVNGEISKYDKATGGKGGNNFNANFNGVSQTANNIVSGGSKPVNITIQLGKLQDKTEIHSTTVTEGVKQMEDAILDSLLRVLNSSQKLAMQ